MVAANIVNTSYEPNTSPTPSHTSPTGTAEETGVDRKEMSCLVYIIFEHCISTEIHNLNNLINLIKLINSI